MLYKNSICMIHNKYLPNFSKIIPGEHTFLTKYLITLIHHFETGLLIIKEKQFKKV